MYDHIDEVMGEDDSLSKSFDKDSKLKEVQEKSTGYQPEKRSNTQAVNSRVKQSH